MVEQLLHKTRQTGRIVRDVRYRIVALSLGPKALLLQQIGIETDSRERRAKPVGDVRDKRLVRGGLSPRAPGIERERRRRAAQCEYQKKEHCDAGFGGHAVCMRPEFLAPTRAGLMPLHRRAD